MEIDVTAFVRHGDMFEFSASRAERGANAGPETWANANAEAALQPLMSDDELPEFRDYVRDFGAWEDDEIDAWTPTECNALLVQMVAGDIREAAELCPGDGPGDIDWTAYEKLAERGTTSGRIFASGEQVFFYVGN